MNVELLLKVKERILAHPNRFMMNSWLVTRYRQGDYFTADDHETEILFDNCGTAACIGGWTCLIASQQKYKDIKDFHSEAARLLEIGYSESEELFAVGYWPNKFQVRYLKATTQEKRAQIAAERIDYYIEKHGKENS